MRILSIDLCLIFWYAVVINKHRPQEEKGGVYMNWEAFVWFALLVFFIAVEASTVTVVSIWFAAGSVTAFVASLLKSPLWLQIVLFFVVSILLLLALRPIT